MDKAQKLRKSIKEKFRKRDKIFGGWLSFEDQSIAELFSSINFDFIAIDMEHTTILNNLAKNIITSCNSRGKPCFPRPVSVNEDILKPLLDAGADGIIAPRVSSSEDLSRLIKNVKYPNLGNRSYGINRAQLYGLDEKEYFKNWNSSSTIIIQIETVEGVNNLRNILENKEIDGVMIGPYDLSGSLGVAGNLKHKKVLEASKYILNICSKHKVSCGTQLSNFDKKIIKETFSKGYNFIILGSDLFALKNWSIECQKIIKSFK